MSKLFQTPDGATVARELADNMLDVVVGTGPYNPIYALAIAGQKDGYATEHAQNIARMLSEGATDDELRRAIASYCGSVVRFAVRGR